MEGAKIELAVVALSNSESQPGSYALILEDSESQRRIPILLGAFEAQAIAIAMERMQPARPLTHDLMFTLIEILDGKVQEVLVYNLVEGIFYAKIILKKNGEMIEVDARTSDAIALAVRCHAPIFTYDNIIKEAGIIPERNIDMSQKGPLTGYSLADLEALLEKVLAKEDYESAARIRNLIKQKQDKY